MSHSINNRSNSFFVVLIVLFLSFGQIACSEPQQVAAGNFLAAVNNKIDATLEEPAELLFTGQVVDGEKNWQNGYVVVLFKDDKEVTRAISRLVDSPLTDEGPMDGVFELRIPNEYKLSSSHIFQDTEEHDITPEIIPGMVGTQFVGAWVGQLNPNRLKIFRVTEKQVQYTIVVLDIPLEQLPEGYRPGRLAFDVVKGELITNLPLPDETEAEQETEETAASTFTINVNSNLRVEFVKLPSQNNGQDWHLQMTGFYGTRWEVWTNFVAEYNIPGLTWEMFETAVLVHNPHLEADNFMFYPNKTYRLPTN